MVPKPCAKQIDSSAADQRKGDLKSSFAAIEAQHKVFMKKKIVQEFFTRILQKIVFETNLI
jgi:hypothetical protein